LKSAPQVGAYFLFFLPFFPIPASANQKSFPQLTVVGCIASSACLSFVFPLFLHYPQSAPFFASFWGVRKQEKAPQKKGYCIIKCVKFKNFGFL